MSSKRVPLIAVSALFVGIGIIGLACTNTDDHPPATSSGGTFTSGSSGTGGSTSGSTSNDGSTTDTGTTSSSGTTSSGGSSGTSSGDSGNNLDPHLTATIDGTAAKFDVTPKAVRQLTDGSMIVLSGSDAAGNSLKVTFSVNPGGMVTTGNYACDGDAAVPGADITYSTTGAAATWQTDTLCSVNVLSIQNQAGGKITGTFNGTAKKLGAAEKVITFGDFNLTLE